MIVAESLTKIFHGPKLGGEFRALDAVSFECRPGRVFGLLGPNGAGKTTTLRVLSTTLAPTSGRALVDGFDVVRQPAEVRRRLGFCTGTTGIYERLTPREMIRYFALLYGMEPDAADARVEALLDLFDMRAFADAPNGRLSAGTRQKVSLARTIVHDPPVLVFDEPTSSLDVLVARTVTDFIAGCRERGKTVILSTHVMAEAEKLCDDLAILHRGRLLAVGSVAEMKARAGRDSIEDLFFQLVGACEGAPSA